MSRATPDDQLRFLLSCVKNSNHGKVDFVEVARECHVVSKGAAAKRYERLLKANNFYPADDPTDDPAASTSPQQKRKASVARGVAGKRKKVDDVTSKPKRELGMNQNHQQWMIQQPGSASNHWGPEAQLSQTLYTYPHTPSQHGVPLAPGPMSSSVPPFHHQGHSAQIPVPFNHPQSLPTFHIPDSAPPSYHFYGMPDFGEYAAAGADQLEMTRYPGLVSTLTGSQLPPAPQELIPATMKAAGVFPEQQMLGRKAKQKADDFILIGAFAEGDEWKIALGVGF